VKEGCGSLEETKRRFSPWWQVVVYSADGLTGEGLRRAAQQKFGVSIPKPVEVGAPFPQGDLLGERRPLAWRIHGVKFLCTA